MSSYSLHIGDDDDLGARTREIRRAVFIDEQGVPEAVEMDDKDPAATHFLLTDGDAPAATARLRFVDESVAKAERVAVLESYRGEGLGRQVMAAVEERAREEGAREIVVHAQRRVEEFYESLGYESAGREFEEAGIPHVEMVKSLGDR